MSSSVPGAPRRHPAYVISVALIGLVTGCGGSGGAATSHSNDTSTGGHTLTGLAAWDAKTEQLCREKAAAIAGLGSVPITYGGIARLGLPTVKRLLTRYLDLRLAVLRNFAARQRALATPPSRVSIMAKAMALDDALHAATVDLRTWLTRVGSPAGLSVAFRTWLADLQRLGVREALAQQLKLPACESARTTAHSVSS